MGAARPPLNSPRSNAVPIFESFQGHVVSENAAHSWSKFSPQMGQKKIIIFGFDSIVVCYCVGTIQERSIDNESLRSM